MKSAVVMVIAFSLALPSLAHANDESAILAKEHFRRGTKLYNLGHFLEAAQEYEAAYQAKDSPALLYNLGQAYRAAGQPEKALTAYRAYLRNVPNAENHDEVVSFIEALKKTIETQKQAKEKPPTDTLSPPPVREPVQIVLVPQPVPTVAPAPVVTPPRDTGPKPRTLVLAGAGTAAFGVASLAVGATFAGLTASVNRQLNHPAPGAPFDPSLEHKGQTYQSLETAFFVVGGAAVVTGAVLFGVGRTRARAARMHATLVPAVGPHGAGASLAFGF